MNINFWKRYLKQKGLAAVVLKANGRVLELLYPVLAITCPFKIKNNKVLFFNFSGKGYGADPKYICEELRKRSGYDLVWAVGSSEAQESVPSDVRTVKLGSFQYYFDMLTAKVWINNIRFDSHIRKRKGQYYLQTWHGFVSLKKIEKDAQELLPKKYLLNAINDSRMADLIPASSMDRVNLLKKSFWYDGPIAETGCPRMDVLYNARGNKEKVKKLLNLNPDVIYVTYAPTFRNSMSLDAYNIDLKMVKEQFEAKLSKTVKIIVRLHPNFGGVDIHKVFGKDVLDGLKFDDGQVLFAASDIVISDYSDALFESAFSGAEVYIYASDIKDYLKERGFYIDYYSLPFDIAENNEQMKNNIIKFDRKRFDEKVKAFWDELGLLEKGTSSVSLAKWVDEKCGIR